MNGINFDAYKNEESKKINNMSWENMFKNIKDNNKNGTVLMKVLKINDMKSFLFFNVDMIGRKNIDANDAINIKYTSLIFIKTCQNETKSILNFFSK